MISPKQRNELYIQILLLINIIITQGPLPRTPLYIPTSHTCSLTHPAYSRISVSSLSISKPSPIRLMSYNNINNYNNVILKSTYNYINICIYIYIYILLSIVENKARKEKRDETR